MGVDVPVSWCGLCWCDQCAGCGLLVSGHGGECRSDCLASGGVVAVSHPRTGAEDTLITITILHHYPHYSHYSHCLLVAVSSSGLGTNRISINIGDKTTSPWQ